MPVNDMKHAYLIIAHKEFEVLRHLVSALDDERNDIFIHFDKKVKQLPEITTAESSLYIMDKRNDVRWGHTSQLEAMLTLYSCALSTRPYVFYHLISGVHLPLQNQDYLHRFFNTQRDKSFLMAMPTSTQEVDLKMRRYHFLIKNFIHRDKTLQRINQLFWLIGVKSQQYLGIKRYKKLDFRKASQWCSLHHEAVTYLVNNHKRIQRKYKYTFCCDEFFIPTELALSPLSTTLIALPTLLKCDFIGVSPKVYTDADISDLIGSGFLFARKFSAAERTPMKTILKHLQKDG